MVNELTLTTVRQAAPPAAISPSVSVEAQGAKVAASGKNAPSTQSSDSAASRTDVLEAVHKMRDYMQIIDRDLHFSVDEDSGLTIVKVIDPSTDEVVRQIPCEEVMRVVRSLESGGGLLSDIKA
jgi:flagellar protein FlaG